MPPDKELNNFQMFKTVIGARMLYWKWRETKLQPSRANSGHQISCCLVSLQFLCNILAPITVHTPSNITFELLEIFSGLCPEVWTGTVAFSSVMGRPSEREDFTPVPDVCFRSFVSQSVRSIEPSEDPSRSSRPQSQMGGGRAARAAGMAPGCLMAGHSADVMVGSMVAMTDRDNRPRVTSN